MTFYRVKLFTDKEMHKDDKDYCLNDEHSLVGIGWGNENCTDIDDYLLNIVPKLKETCKNFCSPYECMMEMSDKSFVWTKINGLEKCVVLNLN